MENKRRVRMNVKKSFNINEYDIIDIQMKERKIDGEIGKNINIYILLYNDIDKWRDRQNNIYIYTII